MTPLARRLTFSSNLPPWVSSILHVNIVSNDTVESMDAIIAFQPNRGHPYHPTQRSGCLTIVVRRPCFHCDQNDRQGFIFTFGLGFLWHGTGRSPFRCLQWIRSHSLIGVAPGARSYRFVYPPPPPGTPPPQPLRSVQKPPPPADIVCWRKSRDLGENFTGCCTTDEGRAAFKRLTINRHDMECLTR